MQTHLVIPEGGKDKVHLNKDAAKGQQPPQGNHKPKRHVPALLWDLSWYLRKNRRTIRSMHKCGSQNKEENRPATKDAISALESVQECTQRNDVRSTLTCVYIHKNLSTKIMERSTENVHNEKMSEALLRVCAQESFNKDHGKKYWSLNSHFVAQRKRSNCIVLPPHSIALPTSAEAVNHALSYTSTSL